MNRKTSIDLAKYIASVMIVAIHTGLFSDINETAYFSVVHIICRMAVPFFAVCSGYFISKQLEFGKTLNNTAHNQAVFIKQWKKLAILYGVWTVLYLFHSVPMWIEIGWFSPFAFVDYAIGAVTKGSHYHFWYLWGMIYTLPVFYLVLRVAGRKLWAVLVVILWMAKAATYAYYPWIPSAVAGVLPVLEKAGTMLCLLPLLLVGAVVATGEKPRCSRCALGLGLSIAGLFAEAFALKSNGQESVSYVFFTLPAAYFLFQLILKARLTGNASIASKLGAVSMLIYCVHPMIVELTEDLFSSSIVHFIFVSAMSTLFGFIYLFIKNRIDRKKVILCSN